MDGKNKTWTLRFPAKENPNMEKALFDWPIVLQYDVKAISRKFFGHEVCLPERSLGQPNARCVCIRSIHQSNRSISVRLLFLFCSRVFISRSYENRSNLALQIKLCIYWKGYSTIPKTSRKRNRNLTDRWWRVRTGGLWGDPRNMEFIGECSLWVPLVSTEKTWQLAPILRSGISPWIILPSLWCSVSCVVIHGLLNKRKLELIVDEVVQVRQTVGSEH